MKKYTLKYQKNPLKVSNKALFSNENSEQSFLELSKQLGVMFSTFDHFHVGTEEKIMRVNLNSSEGVFS